MSKRRKLKGKTYIWMLGSLASISALIYWEQTALLYTLSDLREDRWGTFPYAVASMRKIPERVREALIPWP
jgi:hypothetical protein